jgi:hypothetical protein
MYHFIKLVTLFLFYSIPSPAQDIETILEKARIKINQVNDYQASGKMKTNVAFLKVPVANITVYFKKPNKLKLKSEKGVSFIPKGAVSINMNSLLESDRFTIIDAGTEKINNVMMRVAKLLPLDDNSDVVLSTVYIDPSNFVICKAKTTTRENGTYELVMTYGKYIAYGLPDRIVFSFNTRDYKLPKGVTFDFDDGSEKKKPEDLKNKKGKAEIDFNSYSINKGVPDNIF